MSCKARFSFHSPHKLLDIAHLYRLNMHCDMLELFIGLSIDFILVKS